MLNENTSKAIWRGKLFAVYASRPTGGEWEHSSVIDAKLVALVTALRKACPRVAFETHGAAESFRFIFPNDMGPDETNNVLAALKETTLVITPK